MLAAPQVTPGIYPGHSKASLLRANEQQYLFQAQLVLAGQSSIAVQLERLKGAAYPFGASFQLSFSGDPGAFQFDVQAADLDVDADYVSMNSFGATDLNASFVGLLQLPQMWAKHVRGTLVSITNAVNTSFLVTR